MATPLPQLRERRAGPLNVAIGGRRSGRPLVLVHGIATTWRSWEPLLARLARNHRIIAVDLPGFGGSPPLPTGRFRLEEVADHLREALDALKVREHLLAGHSLGGGVSVAYASANPDRVPALALLAPAVAPTYSSLFRNMWRFELLHHAVRRTARVALPILGRSGRARRAIFAGLVHDPFHLSHEQVDALVRDYTIASGTGPAGIEILAADLASHAPLLTMPTLVLWGDRDEVLPPEFGQRFIASAPDLRLVRLRRCGHLPMFEQPGEVLSALDAFFEPHA